MKKYLLLPLALLCFGLAKAQYTDLLNFNMANGYQPYGSVILSGNTLYGMTSEGGANNDGLIFSVDVNGNNYTDLHDFDGANGKDPQGSLILVGNKLYGMTELGGANPAGTIFVINTNGSGFRTVFNFHADFGFYPYGSLTFSHGTLYGMTNLGGLNGIGNIFSIDTGGSNPKDLLDFDGTHPPYGSFPQGSLIISGNALYGMTMAGGPLGNGIVFSINTDGTGFTDLFDFNQTNGADPRGDLTLAGNVLYGMAGGGPNQVGVVFSLHTNGTGFTDLLDFNGTNGYSPLGGFTLSGNTLYGFTDNGGANNDGLIFSIDTNGNNYTDLWDFTYPTGINPWGGALALSGKTLYGMCEYGGANVRDGVVFRFIDSAIAVPPLTAYISGVANVLCHGGNTGSATLTTSGGAPPYTYIWMPAGGTNATATNLSAGTYTVTVTAAVSNTVICTVAITQPSALIVTANALNDTICKGSSTVLTSAATGGVPVYQYTWNNGSTSLNATVSPLTSTCYTVIVTDANGCRASDTACVVVKTCTGISQLSSRLLSGSSQWSVEPNPNNGKFTISIRNYVPQLAGRNVQVYNILGKIVYSQFLIPNSQFLINLSAQPNGVYFYRVVAEDGGTIWEGKVVIER